MTSHCHSDIDSDDDFFTNNGQVSEGPPQVSTKVSLKVPDENDNQSDANASEKESRPSPTKNGSPQTSALLSADCVNPEEDRAVFKAEPNTKPAALWSLIAAYVPSAPKMPKERNDVKNLIESLFIKNDHSRCQSATSFFETPGNGAATCYILPDVAEFTHNFPYMIGFVKPFKISPSNLPRFVLITVSTLKYAKQSTSPRMTMLSAADTAKLLCSQPTRFPANACIMGWQHQALRWLANNLYANMVYTCSHTEISNIAQEHIKSGQIDYRMHVVYLDSHLYGVVGRKNKKEPCDRDVACCLFYYNTLSHSEIPKNNNNNNNNNNSSASVEDFTKEQLESHEERLVQWTTKDKAAWRTRTDVQWKQWMDQMAECAAQCGHTSTDQNESNLCGNRKTFKDGLAIMCKHSLDIRKLRTKKGSSNWWGALDHFMQWYVKNNHVSMMPNLSMATKSQKPVAKRQLTVSSSIVETKKQAKRQREAEAAKKLARNLGVLNSEDSHSEDESLDSASEVDLREGNVPDSDDDYVDSDAEDTDEDCQDGDDSMSKSASDSASELESDLDNLKRSSADSDDSSDDDSESGSNSDLLVGGPRKRRRTASNSSSKKTCPSAEIIQPVPVLPTQTREHYAQQLSSITTKLSNMSQGVISAYKATHEARLDGPSNSTPSSQSDDILRADLPLNLLETLSSAHATLGFGHITQPDPSEEMHLTSTNRNSNSDVDFEDLDDNGVNSNVQGLFEEKHANAPPTIEQMHTVVGATLNTLVALTSMMEHSYAEVAKSSPEAAKMVLIGQKMTDTIAETAALKAQNAQLKCKLNQIYMEMSKQQLTQLEEAMSAVKRHTQAMKTLNGFRELVQ